MKALVVYYSLSGKTEIVAKAIASELNADIVRIEEVKPFRPPWVYFGGSMAARGDKLVKIKPCEVDLGDYDTVFIGAPVWAGKPAPAVNTFIADNDFTDKRVVVFCTLGGKGGSEITLRSLMEKAEKRSARITGAFAVTTGGVSDEILAEEARMQVRKITER